MQISVVFFFTFDGDEHLLLLKIHIRMIDINSRKRKTINDSEVEDEERNNHHEMNSSIFPMRQLFLIDSMSE